MIYVSQSAYNSVKVSDLSKYLLQHKPQIVHFSGHGSKLGEIYFENDLGKKQAVGGRNREIDFPNFSSLENFAEDSVLAEFLSSFKQFVKCVVLNACYSETQAQAIIKQIPCVLGMSRAIEDKSAILFSREFYQGLAFGESLENAFEIAKNTMGVNNLKSKNILQKLGYYEFSILEKKDEKLNPLG